MLNKNSIIDVVIKSSGRERKNFINLCYKHRINWLETYLYKNEYIFNTKRNYNSDITLQKIYSYFQEYLPNEIIDKIFSYDTYSSPMLNVFKELIFYQPIKNRIMAIELDLRKSKRFLPNDAYFEKQSISSLYTQYLTNIDISEYDTKPFILSKISKFWQGDELKRIYKDPRTRPSQNCIYSLIGKKNKNMEFVLKKIIAVVFCNERVGRYYFRTTETAEEYVSNLQDICITLQKQMLLIIKEKLQENLNIVYELIWKDCYRLSAEMGIPTILKDERDIDTFYDFNCERYQDLDTNFTNRMLCNNDIEKITSQSYELPLIKHISLEYTIGIQDKEMLMYKFQNDFDMNKIPIEFKKSWTIKKMKSIWLNEGREIFLTQLKKKFNKVLKELLKKIKIIEADIVCKDCPSRIIYKYQLCYGCYASRLSA